MDGLANGEAGRRWLTSGQGKVFFRHAIDSESSGMEHLP